MDIKLQILFQLNSLIQITNIELGKILELIINASQVIDSNNIIIYKLKVEGDFFLELIYS